MSTLEQARDILRQWVRPCVLRDTEGRPYGLGHEPIPVDAMTDAEVWAVVDEIRKQAA